MMLWALKTLILILVVLLLPSNTLGVDDPWILCSQDVPEMSSWPAGYSGSTFTNNLELCSGAVGLKAEDGSSRNVGCVCSGSSSLDLIVKPICLRQYADIHLWRSTGVSLQNGRVLKNLCSNYLCVCLPRLIVNMYIEEGRRSLANFEYSKTNGMITAVLPMNETADFETILPSRANATTLGNTTTASPADQGQCSSEDWCHSLSDCPTVEGLQPCGCYVQSTTVIPGSGTDGIGSILHASACMVSGLKRDVDTPACPCNSTYISHGCCDVADGLIWEKPEAQIPGRLWTPEDL